MDIKDVHVQYDRLLRHFQAATATKDEISLLDLAHALRIWVDMKSDVEKLARERGGSYPLSITVSPKPLRKPCAAGYIPMCP